jgi:hypothetical protein
MRAGVTGHRLEKDIDWHGKSGLNPDFCRLFTSLIARFHGMTG